MVMKKSRQALAELFDSKHDVEDDDMNEEIMLDLNHLFLSSM